MIHGSVHPKILHARQLVMAERRRAHLRHRLEQQRLRSLVYRSRLILGVTLVAVLVALSIGSVVVGLTWSVWWPLAVLTICSCVSPFLLHPLFDPDFVDRRSTPQDTHD